MEKMFDYEALIHFSWSGKSSIEDSDKNKLPFAELVEIIKLVAELTKNKHSEDALPEIKYFMKRVPQCFRSKLTNK